MSQVNDELWDACKDDLKVLISYIWKRINLPTPAFVQFDMADFMQDDTIDRKLCTAMRGGAKTYIGCARCIQVLMKNPNAEVLIISKSGEKAAEFSHLIRSWIMTLPLLAPLRPRQGQRNNIAQFDVGTRTIDSHSASITAKGITGTITGGRAHFILVDDVETQDNAFTQDQKEKLLLKLTECENIIHPGGIIQYNGTFQSEESIYLSIAKSGYVMRSWPGRYCSPQETEKWSYMSPALQDKILRNQAKPLEPTFPSRYDEEELCKREALMGRSQFALQFLLDPSLSDKDKYPLKLRDLIYLNTSPEQVPTDVVWAASKENVADAPLVGLSGDRWYRPMRVGEIWMAPNHVVMAIDPSGRGADECAWIVGSFLNTRIFLLDSGGATDGFGDETLRLIAESCWENNVKEIVTEPNYGGGMFSKLLSPVLKKYYDSRSPKKRPPIVSDTPHVTGMKETRIINILEPFVNQHKLIVSSKVAEDTTLWHQYTRMQHKKDALKHDDRVDALSMLVAHFCDMMNIDDRLLNQQLDEEYRQNELKKFDSKRGNRLVFGSKNKKKKNWINR